MDKITSLGDLMKAVQKKVKLPKPKGLRMVKKVMSKSGKIFKGAVNESST